MSIEQTLYATLIADADVAPLVVEATSPLTYRVYPHVAPDEVSRPYIVYAVIFAEKMATHQGLTNLRHARVQVDCYAETFAGARVLADHVVDAIDTGMKVGEMNENPSFYFDDLELHRVSVDFSLWE